MSSNEVAVVIGAGDATGGAEKVCHGTYVGGEGAPRLEVERGRKGLGRHRGLYHQKT